MQFVLYVVYARFQKCICLSKVKREASQQRRTQAEETPGSLTGDLATLFIEGFNTSPGHLLKRANFEVAMNFGPQEL